MHENIFAYRQNCKKINFHRGLFLHARSFFKKKLYKNTEKNYCKEKSSINKNILVKKKKKIDRG